MRYKCRIMWPLHDIPHPGDVRVSTDQNIRDTVRVITAEMLTAQALDPASPVEVTITDKKAIADLIVHGRSDTPITFMETMEGINQ